MLNIVKDIINLYEDMRFASVVANWHKLCNLRKEYSNLEFNKDVFGQMILYTILFD